jgi:hypothetical protein
MYSPQGYRAEIQTWDLLYLAVGRHANNLAKPHSHWSSYGPDLPTPHRPWPSYALCDHNLPTPQWPWPSYGPGLPTPHRPWPSYALFDRKLPTPHWPWPSYISLTLTFPSLTFLRLTGLDLPTPDRPWPSHTSPVLTYASPALSFLRRTPNLTTLFSQHYLKTTCEMSKSNSCVFTAREGYNTYTYNIIKALSDVILYGIGELPSHRAVHEISWSFFGVRFQTYTLYSTVL